MDKILSIRKVREGDEYLHDGILYPVEHASAWSDGVMLTLRGFGTISVTNGLHGAVRRAVRSRPPSGHRISVGLGQMERDWLLAEAAERNCTAAEVIRQALFLYRTVRNEQSERGWLRRRRWARLLPWRGSSPHAGQA